MGVDAIRFLAAAMVVWIHVPREGWWAGSTSISRWAVPYFSFLAGYAVVASMRSRPDETIPQLVGRRFVRLYLPFLAWCVIYYALRGIKRGAGGVPVTIDAILLSGPVQQLWFLPFAFIAGIAGAIGLRPVVGKPGAERTAAVVVLALSVVPCAIEAGWRLHSPAGEGATVPWRMTVNLSYQALPAFLCGLAAALWLGRGMGALRGPWWLVPLGLAVAAGATVLAWRTQPIMVESFALENVAGIGAVLFAAGLPASGPLARGVRAVGALGVLAYGIYLAHIIFVQGGQMAADRLGLPPSLSRDLGILMVAVVGSGVLAAILRRWRGTRWLSP
jgi:peptidoglycan/LPS O-acetylase OafA/YrhL